MVQTLKRKRTEVSGSRKSPRLDAPDIVEEQDSSESEGEDEDEEAPAEDDNWGGISGTPADVRPEGSKPIKLPKGEELRAITDAADLFKSSSFKLQIDVLLPSVRPKASKIPPVERFLFELHTRVKEIKSKPPQHPLEASRKLQKKSIAVPYPLPLPTEETNWKVAFEPPSDIILVGSWANKVVIKAKDGIKFGVDLAVEMPESLFQEKDYLNGRFFHKRAYYLAVIAEAVQKLPVDVSYESLHGDPRLTKLVLTSKNDEWITRVCIIPVLPANHPIPLHRLSPSHSNVRVNSNDQPTPLYNTALLRAITPKNQLLSVHSLQKTCTSFSDALTLLRIWANQRGYCEGTKPCISGFEGAGPFWCGLLQLLLEGEEARQGASKRRAVGRGVSSYQLFKAALEFLAKHDFEKEPAFVKSVDGHRYPPEEYEQHAEAAFVDSSSLTNLLAGVPLGSLQVLRYDAARTLETLNRASFSGDLFTGVFLKDCRDLFSRFDVVLRVSLASAQSRSPSVHATVDAGSPASALLSQIGALLRRGLGERSRAVTLLHPTFSSRPVSQAHPSSPDVVFIGIIHNPQHSFRLVDHGPAADDTDEEALKSFRDFWGDKAELRRFKDGRIVESVVWEVTTADERAHVPSMIVKHLLKRHFSIEDESVEVWQGSFDSVLRLPPSISKDIISSGVATGVKSALTAFDDLVKSMKKLDDQLPLSLLTVSPTSESLRYTNVFSPIPMPLELAASLPPNARYLAPIEIILEFEKSSKWPDDLNAVQTIKLAFFERLATALMESVEGLSARVVLGDGTSTSTLTEKSFLEIVTPSGWAFNARIFHDRELDLIHKIIQGNGDPNSTASRLPHVVVSKSKLSKEERKLPAYYDALHAKDAFIRRFIHAPRHHRAIATLSHHYTAYAGTVRLVKRWLASHWLLGGHVSEEAVELLCAAIFVEGSGRSISESTDTEESLKRLVPASKERGFAEVVRFLKEWKWEEGLFVGLYDGSEAASSGKESSISSGSLTSVWRISTEHDKEGVVWMNKGPDAVVAHRIKALANATWNCLQGVDEGQLNVHGLFIHPDDDYDFIIQLDPLVLPRYLHNVNPNLNKLARQGKYANRTKEDDEAGISVLPGFNPAWLFFLDLQRIYADTFKVFYDPLGGDKIGGVWDPTLKEPRPFRVMGAFSSMPVQKNENTKEKNLVSLNQEAIMAEVERMGMGLVKKIIVSS